MRGEGPHRRDYERKGKEGKKKGKPHRGEEKKKKKR